MRKGKCELCGRQIDFGIIERHHVIPPEVTEEAGLPESKTLRVCSNCHREVHTWYSARVSDMYYDSEAKRFTSRASPEVAKEYKSAFDNFVKYRKGQTEDTEQP